MKRNYVINIIKTIFEKYGFEPLETPTLELWETLSGKYGEEGDRLTYRFVDRGDREVGLRYDLTVPLSRVIAMYPQIPKPFKRYQIQPVWRADKPQKGRFREFYQCDVDIVGSASMLADAEILAVIHEILTTLNFREFQIRINNRKVLSGIVEVSGAGRERELDVYRAIDKLDKIGPEGVREELLQRQISPEATATIMDLLSLEGSNTERVEKARSLLGKSAPAQEGLDELQELFQYLEAYGIPSAHYLFDLTLARGLDYYTGPIYETVVLEPRIGSLTGGGRYDRLIGLFSGQDQPATGSSVGLERIITVMEELDMFPSDLNTPVAVLVTVFDESTRGYSIAIARQLREAGINTDLYTGKSKLRGQIGLANDKGIPLVVIAGPDEQAASQVNVKNMRTGEQTAVTVTELVEHVKSQLFPQS
ncbi:MAG: histidine--tRNA ligase [Calditrichaeota bacterium]|nr:MAG: histidine--tRNA ligase [Calditrichota bacterium]